MTVLQIKLLGPPEFWFEGHRLGPLTRKSAALLTWLAASGGGQTRQSAAELFWARNGLRNLRQELYVIRKLPGAEQWLVSEPTLSLLGAVDVDQLTEGGDPRVWCGVPGEGLDGVKSETFQEWLADFRTQMEERRVRCVVAHTRGALEGGDLEAADAAVTPLLADAVPQESIWRLALEVRLQQGRRREAQALFEGARSRFDVRSSSWAALARHLSESSPLQGLTPTARRTLELAALDPDPLPVEVLAEALDCMPLTLVTELQSLHDADLWPEEGMAASTRALVLAGLPPQAKAALHGRLALALESNQSPIERVAPHIEGAGRRDAASVWLALARRGGRIEAVDGALRTARTPLERTDALLEAILATRSTCDWDRAERHGAELQGHALRSQEPKALRQSPLQAALTAGARRDVERANVAMAVCIEALGKQDPDVRAVHGMLALMQGHPEVAQPHLEAGLLAKEVTLRIGSANGLGVVASLSGDSDLAHQHHLRCLEEARSAGRLRTVSRLLNSLGANALSRHDVGVALDWLDQAHRLAEEIGDTSALPLIRFNLANTWIKTGAFGMARPLIANLVEGAKSELERGRAFRCRAALERGVNRPVEARAWSTRARRAFEAGADPLQATVCAFNEALSGREQFGFEPLEAAFEDIVAHCSAPLSRYAASELAVVHPDPKRIASLLCDDPDSPLEIASHLRATVLGVPQARDCRPRAINSVVNAYGWVLFAALHPEQELAIRERLQSKFARWEEGLLGSQKEALRQRIERWWRAPEWGF